MSIVVHVRNNELSREFSAQDLVSSGIVVTVHVPVPALMRKDRAELVARAREITNAILHQLLSESPIA